MRVTNRMMAMSSIADMQNALERLEKYQKQLASGKTINKPSDNPVGASKSMIYRSSLNKIEQLQKNVSSSKEIISLTDSSLADVNNIVTKMRELATKGADSSYNKEQKKALADEFDQMLDHVFRLSNLNDGTRYLFSGTNLDEKSYVKKNGKIYYNGNQESIKFQIDEGAIEDINLPGSEIFNSSITSKNSIKDKKVSLSSISDLHPSVQAGSFYINDTAIEIDPSVDSLSDVVKTINNADANAHAELTVDNELKITALNADGEFSIREDDSNFLLAMGMTTHINGGKIASANNSLDLSSSINNDTFNLLESGVQLKRLNDGAGITTPIPANSFSISDSDGNTINIDISSLDENSTLSEVETVINDTISTAPPAFNVDKVYFEYKNDSLLLRPNSDEINISEGAGTTAADLGLAGISGTRNNPAESDPLNPDLGVKVDKNSTEFGNMFNGTGLSKPYGVIKIQDGSGNSLDVDLSALSDTSTVKTLENHINDAITSARNDSSDPNYPTNLDFNEINIDINYDQLEVSVPEGQIQISDSSGTTANELGINSAAAADTIYSDVQLDPQMEGFNLTLTGEDREKLSSYIDLKGVNTVGEVINRINNDSLTVDGENLDVRAFLSEDGTSIDIYSMNNSNDIAINNYNDKTAETLNIKKENESFKEMGIFDTLIKIKKYLKEDNGDAVSHGLKWVDSSLDKVLDARSLQGSRLNRSELVEKRLLKSNEEITRLLSENEDTDVAKTSMQFSMMQTMYQSSLKTASMSLPVSLVKFL